MRIDNIRIINFRGIKEIDFKTDAVGILIVGPNAVGKSTILEAIRLNKSFLFPNIQNESMLVLNSIKAISPDQQRINSNTLLNDCDKKLNISIDYSIEEYEVNKIDNIFINKLHIMHLQNTNRFPMFREPFSEAQFLSSEDGKKILDIGKKEIDLYIKNLLTTKKLSSNLTIDNSLISGSVLLDQEFLTILCESTGYAHTYFNYFPADRSLPFGDQPLQIGFANAIQQLQSYMATPQSKYQLIKQFIINMYLTSEESKENIKSIFGLIFDYFLPGKSLSGVEINSNGNLSILINDNSKGSKYDIDSMSSGEKNLLLTLLFMELTTAENGIILFDEPELHLNPAVQKKIISFLIDVICKIKKRQILLCTHSPEMFASAFERDDCKIFHLISEKDISPIYKQDKTDVFGVLQKLGSTSTDLLSTKGIIYLEGPHDTELLDNAISSLMGGFTPKHLGGRKEIEKSIITLQEEDNKKRLDSYQLFIFDLDNKPTGLESTRKVKLLQWDRYCLENYLLEPDAIYEVLKDCSTNSANLTRGSMLGSLKEIAFKQIIKISCKKVVSGELTDNHYLKITEIVSDTPEQTVDSFFSVLNTVSKETAKLHAELTRVELLARINGKVTQISDEWQSKWVNNCDGKLVISDLHKEFKVQMSLLNFKKKIIEVSRIRNFENWRLIESKLKELVDSIE